MRETAVEKRLIKKVKEAGGVCMKILPVVGGYPDRLVLLPGGRLYLIETKKPGEQSKKDGGLRPLQVVFKDRAAEIGVHVTVLYTSAQVDAWVAERMAEDFQ